MKYPKYTISVAGLAPPEHRTLPVARPATRASCELTARPCPFVGCRHHLAIDILRKGSIRLHFPVSDPRSAKDDADKIDWEAMPESCALDVGDSGPHTLEDVAALLRMHRENVRLIEASAIAKFRTAWDALKK